MANSKFSRILNLPDKGVSKARGVLTGLTRKMLYKFDISEFEWEEKLTRYLDNPVNGFEGKAKKQNQRGNITSTLEKDDGVSWSRLMEFVAILDVDEVDFTLTLKDGDRTITVTDKHIYRETNRNEN